MKLSTIAVAAAALVSSVAAAPSPAPQSQTSSGWPKWKGNGVWTHLYYCAEKDWVNCQNWNVEKERCYNIKDFGAKFVANTGSVGPDAGTFCTLYNVENCDTKQDRLYANYPGYSHLDGHNWNKKAKSFSCW